MELHELEQFGSNITERITEIQKKTKKKENGLKLRQLEHLFPHLNVEAGSHFLCFFAYGTVNLV